MVACVKMAFLLLCVSVPLEYLERTVKVLYHSCIYVFSRLLTFKDIKVNNKLQMTNISLFKKQFI